MRTRALANEKSVNSRRNGEKSKIFAKKEKTGDNFTFCTNIKLESYLFIYEHSSVGMNSEYEKRE